MRRLRRAAVYILGFVAARGMLFAAPLALASSLPPAAYAELETAQAAASLTATIGAFGTASLVPLLLLQRESATTLRAVIAQHLLLAACGLALGLAAWVHGAPRGWSLTALLTAALGMQSLASVHLRTLGHTSASLLMDAGVMSMLALVAWTVTLLHAEAPHAWLAVAVALHAVTAAAVYAAIAKRQPPSLGPSAWSGTLRLGLPLLLGGLVSLLATTSGRLGMGLLAAPAEAAAYAVVSRGAALPVVAHQLILVARFRDIFALPMEAAVRATQQVVVAVAVGAALFMLLAPWFGNLLGPAFVAAWRSHRAAGGWIVAQAVLWSAIALNDLLATRGGCMARVLPWTAAAIVLPAAAAAWWLREDATVERFVAAHSVVMLLFYLVQSLALRRQGVRGERAWISATALFASLALGATFAADR